LPKISIHFNIKLEIIVTIPIDEYKN